MFDNGKMRYDNERIINMASEIFYDILRLSPSSPLVAAAAMSWQLYLAYEPYRFGGIIMRLALAATRGLRCI